MFLLLLLIQLHSKKKRCSLLVLVGLLVTGRNEGPVAWVMRQGVWFEMHGFGCSASAESGARYSVSSAIVWIHH